MVRFMTLVVAALCVAFVAAGCRRESAPPPAGPSVSTAPMKAPSAKPEDLKEQSVDAVARGLQYLRDAMKPDGSIGAKPGITALDVLAMLRSGNNYNPKEDPFIRKPIEYLLSFQKPNGGIYEHELANYTTAIIVQVLIETKDPKYADAVKKARGFLLGIQNTEANGFESGDAGYGGIAYSDDNLRADLSNTQTWADAMKDLEASGLPRDSEAWKRAAAFAARCQNRSESNDLKWAKDGDQNGGATYSPWESKAMEITYPNGNKGLRSYGSMTYAFLKTMIYADVKKDDPRVQAAYKWIQKHYTVDENPEMGQMGYFYYMHTMVKALKAMGEKTVVDEKGVAHDWRKDIAEKVLSLQQPDGSWVNKTDRWFESDPVLVTAYACLILEELSE